MIIPFAQKYGPDFVFLGYHVQPQRARHNWRYKIMTFLRCRIVFKVKFTLKTINLKIENIVSALRDSFTDFKYVKEGGNY